MTHYVKEEAVPDGKQLLEDYFPMEYDLAESNKGGNSFCLIGKFGETDIPTANKRIYTRPVMIRETARVSEAAKSGRLYGTLDHPPDGRTRLREASHLIKSLTVTEDGIIEGVIELIPGTAGGDQAIAIAKVGGQLGISSRGHGTTARDENGNHVVQEDYRLVSFDIVADPANAGAYPKFVGENKGQPKEGQMKLTLKELKDHPDLYDQMKKEIEEEIRPSIEEESREHARNATREDFDAELTEAAREIRGEAYEKAKEDLEKDPKVAGAMAAMEAIKGTVLPFIMNEDENEEIGRLRDRLADAEKRLAESERSKLKTEQDCEELAQISAEIGVALFVEKELSGDDRRDKVVTMLGDFSQYGDIDEVRERLNAAYAVIEEDEQREDAHREELSELRKKEKELKERNEKLEKTAHMLAQRIYLETKLKGNPNAKKISRFVEASNPKSKKQIDELVESFMSENGPSDEYVSIRRGLGQEDEDDGEVLGEDNSNIEGGVLGVGFDEILEASIGGEK